MTSSLRQAWIPSIAKALLVATFASAFLVQVGVARAVERPSAPSVAPVVSRQASRNVQPTNSPKPATIVPPAAIESTTDAEPALGRQSYRFAASLDYPRGTLDVVETLDWTSLGATAAGAINLSVLPAHANAFHLTGEVTVDGTAADAQFARYDTNLRISFATPVERGATVRIVIPFRLVVGVNAGALGGRLSYQRGVIQFGDWFPIWSTQHGFYDIGDSQVSWNADSVVLDLTSTTSLGINAVASSGVLAPGATASHWLYEAHNVRNFAFAVDPAYSVATRTISCHNRSVQVRAYSYQTPATQILGHAVEAMTAYNNWYGCYDQPTFSLAEVGTPYFSMEFPTLVFLGAKRAADAEIVYHETAHQWWYSMVGDNQMTEPWLDESFAEFSAQALAGKKAYCSSAKVRSSVYDFTTWSECDQYIATIYGRGAAFLRALRARMGDDAFFFAMKLLVSTYDRKIVTTDEALDFFRGASPRDIESLISDFGLNPGR